MSSKVERATGVFRFTCIDCEAVYRAACESGFVAARMASAKHWTFAKGLERCPTCSTRATGKVSRKR